MVRINYKHTEETKRKMSNNHRCKNGKSICNKGLNINQFKEKLNE